MACNCGGSCGGAGCGGLSPCSTLGVSQNEVNTPNCTAQLGVNQGICGQSAGRICSCNNCGCQQSGVCTPTPYYLQAPGCQESHNQILINQQWAMSAKVLEGFAVPGCNPPQSVTVTIPGLTQILIGTYLQTIIGGTPIYLKVVAFDYVNSRVTLENDLCRENVLSPGTSIPACSLFNVANVIAPATNNNDDSYPYVADDFVAPNVGACIDPLNVTTSVGLSVNQVISILGGTYTVAAIYGATSIKICNDTGGGLAPNTPVIAHDSGGNHVVPIVGLNTNPCTNPVVTQGAILTCHNGVQQPLDGSYYGQVPVLIEPATNEVEFRTLDVATLECTHLLQCTNITQGVNASPYTFVIDNDPAIIIAGDVVQVTFNGHIYIFEVVGAPVANPSNITANLRSVDGILGALPPETVCIGIGVDLCHSPCCEQLAADIDNIVNVIIPDNCAAADAALACITQVHTYGPRADQITLSLAAGGGNWLYYGATNDTAYIDQPLAIDPLTITVPSHNCGDAELGQYLIEVHGIIQMNVDADAPLGAADGIILCDIAAIMNSVDVYMTSNMPAGATAPVYAESGHVTNSMQFIRSYPYAKWGAPVSVEPDGGGAGVLVNSANGFSTLDGWYPHYLEEDFPTLTSVVDADRPIYDNLEAYGSIRYHAAGFVCNRLCVPGEVLTLNARYRALADADTMPVATPAGACEIRIGIYCWATASRYSLTPSACV